jgi:Major tropism determinant N-terminal domain
MPAVIQVKRGTASSWTSANTVLAAGEIGFETDTKKMKVGDGSTAWNSLSYTVTDGDISGVTAGTGLSGGGSSGSVTLSLSTPVSVANGGTGITSFGTGVATWLGTPSSANLAAAVTDETGSGALVFGTSPTISGGTFSDAVIRQPLATPTFSANAYTLALSDQGDILLASNGSTAGTISVPTNASVAFPTGTQITIIQTGSGQLTISATTPATTTIASTGATSTAPKLRAQNSSATLIKTGTDTWYVVGDIS